MLPKNGGKLARSVSGTGHWAAGTGQRAPGSGQLAPGTGHWAAGTGQQMPNSSLLMLVKPALDFQSTVLLLWDPTGKFAFDAEMVR